MLPPLIITVTVVLLIGLALAFCISCDSIERRWRLKRFRRKAQTLPNMPDDKFAAALPGIQPAHALEMRWLLAELLSIDALKIQPDWKFRQEPDLLNLDAFIFHAFAVRYAPSALERRTFAFPKGPVTTVHDLFFEVSKLQNESYL